jgi:hypothetical protein
MVGAAMTGVPHPVKRITAPARIHFRQPPSRRFPFYWPIIWQVIWNSWEKFLVMSWVLSYEIALVTLMDWASYPRREVSEVVSEIILWYLYPLLDVIYISSGRPFIAHDMRVVGQRPLVSFPHPDYWMVAPS